MFEGKRMVAGEAILSGAATIDRNSGQSRAESTDRLLADLVCEHTRMIYRIAYAVLRSHHDAEDATQETFVRVLRYQSKLATVEDPKTWLARIAWRVAVDRSRQRRRKHEIMEEPQRPFDEIPSSETPADDSIVGAQFSELLEKLIAALPEKLRDPLILSSVEEMSPREVAVTLGINEAAVRSRVFRARQILKEKLSQCTTRK